MVDPALTAIRVLDAVGLVLVVGLLGVAWIGRDERESRLLFGILAGVAVWIAGDLLVKVPVLLAFAAPLVDVQLVASAVAVTFLFLFVAEYTGRSEFGGRTATAALAVEPVAVTALILTNPAHGLVYDPAAAGGQVVASMGPALLVHALYSYFLVLLGVALLADFVGRANEAYGRQAVAVGVGAVVPLVGNALYLFGASPYDLTPVSYAVTGVLLTDAVVRADLLRLSPVARGTVLDTAPVSVFVLAPDGSVLDANPLARELVDAGEDSLLGRDAIDLFDGHPAMAERLDATLPADERREFTVETDAEAFEVRVSPLSARGTGRGDVVIVSDVTERKQYERELEERTERLELLNRVVRHDIRNDMTLILGYADALENHVDEDGRRYLDPIHDTGSHVVDITRNVRELMETMLGETEPQPVELEPILATELEDLDSSEPSARVRVDGELPSVWVRGDRMLRSVFRNLLKNAVQHNPGDHPEVVVSVAEKGDRVVVSVADDGRGVPDERKEAIFGKGEMGLESEGTGIGLYLVGTLIAAYGGEVWVEDRATGGSADDPAGAVFKVALRREDPPPEPAQRRSERSPTD
jgi:PAS domain S-box-containing protein